jgi:hypothetical protein
VLELLAVEFVRRMREQLGREGVHAGELVALDDLLCVADRLEAGEFVSLADELQELSFVVRARLDRPGRRGFALGERTAQQRECPRSAVTAACEDEACRVVRVLGRAVELGRRRGPDALDTQPGQHSGQRVAKLVLD